MQISPGSPVCDTTCSSIVGRKLGASRHKYVLQKQRLGVSSTACSTISVCNPATRSSTMVGHKAHRPSPFLGPESITVGDSLAILHLKRDHQIPAILRLQDEQHEGYDEGKVTNTRFGSFPHSTLIGVPWGSQVRASTVDTGSRGRRAPGEKGTKRKRDGEDQVVDDNAIVMGEEEAEVGQKAAVTAPTGFVHVLPPTPEIWTSSLPHRTQVVYTPDYSYILHRLRARPGTVVIEAGAGSGSFTHAAARAVFNGYPNKSHTAVMAQSPKEVKVGKIWSFEFHEQRVQKLKTEISNHGLDGIVEITHKDVCQEGFRSGGAITGGLNANAIFLDLPAPWLALRHLTRRVTIGDSPSIETVKSGDLEPSADDKKSYVPQRHGEDSDPVRLDIALGTTEPQSLLDPTTSIHLCTFSPCIEQVQRTITTMRQLGWVDIEMVEIAAKRIDVRRERVGLQEEGLRGVNASPASVDEALARLRELEGRSRQFHSEPTQDQIPAQKLSTFDSPTPATHISKQQRLENIREALDARKLYKEGRLVHRAEAELKTHTSYLVFAILPREWTAADELAAQQEWSAKFEVNHQSETPMSNRQRKKAAKVKAGGNKAFGVQQDVQEEVTLGE